MPVKQFAQNQPCPCGSERAYGGCCGRFLGTECLPGSAEHLMRSRYVAYMLEDETYLLATWHPDSRPSRLHFERDASPKWLGLTIKRSVDIDDANALVEFVARYKINGRAFRLHETSRFELIDGRWYYRDGEIE